MNKYQELLERPEWKEKRERILERTSIKNYWKDPNGRKSESESLKETGTHASFAVQPNNSKCIISIMMRPLPGMFPTNI